MSVLSEKGLSLFLLLFSLSVLLPGSSYGSLPTHEEYVVYKELEQQLVSGEDASYQLYRLSEVFYPKVGPSPICVPVTYTLTCPNATVIDNCTSRPIPCVETEADSFNASYLWSHYDLGAAIGPVLLSYAWSGIRLRGFAWEDSCDLDRELRFVLDIDNISCRSGEVIKSALKAMTAVARSYAKNQGSRGSPGDSGTKGYALDWDHEDRETYVFHTSHYTLISMVVVLNIFVLLTATVMTTFTYNAVYKEILHKRNPYYPLFWSTVVLSFLWNVGPSWLVLSGKYELVYYSLVFMVPLEGLVAVCIMKKGDFPVPLLLREGCPKHAGNLSIFDRTLIARCCINCLVSYTLQTLAIWTVIVFVTFLSYYMVAIIIAFYLYPTEVLVKVVFLKAVAVAAILNVALLFSNSRFKCKCKKLKHDLVYLVRVLAIAAFLPILGFLAFVIGGILFTRSQQTSGLKSVLTLLPSAVLVFGAWFTKGTLFPPGTDEADLGSEVINDLEGGGGGDKHAHSETTPTSSGATATSRKTSPPAAHSPTPQSGQGGASQEASDESKPLLL